MSTPTPPPSGFSLFFAELKRRHVVRFALGYAAVAFVVLQLAEIIFPAFDIGETGVRILVVAVGLLFPPALVAAWIFDLTPKGIERTERAPGAAKAGVLPRLALLGVTVAIMGSLGAWLVREGDAGRARWSALPGQRARARDLCARLSHPVPGRAPPGRLLGRR